MGLTTTILLGAFAGLTIFLGLPLARLERPPRRLQAFLTAIAAGVLIFLLYDVLAKASEPIDAHLAALQQGRGQATTLFLYLGLLALGLAAGALSLVYFERFAVRRGPGAAEGGASRLALMIAAGIGLHNFSEGLAIGQAAMSGALALASTLIVGFALHNMTEGFGIAAPLAGGPRPSWRFLGLAGLIGGGPTFLGTLAGVAVVSPAVFILFLALAAGAILYVVGELLHVGRMLRAADLAMWGLLAGFLAGYGTDLLLTWAGA
jgi:ZIP family zinc transporter